MTTTPKKRSASITLRLTGEQLSQLAEVRAYVARAGRTAFGAPRISDREAVVMLMDAGYRKMRKTLRPDDNAGKAAGPEAGGEGREDARHPVGEEGDELNKRARESLMTS